MFQVLSSGQKPALFACSGIIDLFDDFAPPGDGVSRLLVDAASKKHCRVVRAMLIALCVEVGLALALDLALAHRAKLS